MLSIGVEFQPRFRRPGCGVNLHSVQVPPAEYFRQEDGAAPGRPPGTPGGRTGTAERRVVPDLDRDSARGFGGVGDGVDLGEHLAEQHRRRLVLLAQLRHLAGRALVRGPRMMIASAASEEIEGAETC